jgi:hypothetical protein
MGNEASTPHQDEGLAPPSQIPPGEAFDHASANHRPGHSIKAIFQRGGKADDGHDSARAAAENGLMPFGATAPLSAQQLQAPQFLQVAYDARAQSGATNQPTLHQQFYQHGGHPSYASSTTGPVDVKQQPHPMVGVMYASDGGSSSTRSTGNTLRNSGKVVRESGRKVMNSLKNLSLGQRGSSKKGIQKEENEWETRWDEDDDESDEDEEDVKIGPASAGVHLRPGMDGGHSSSTPTLRVEPAVPVTPPPEAKFPVTPPRVTPAAAQVGALDADGLEWDTGTGLDIIPQQDPTYEKPNILMFLPLLRVLGKGSFGKVRMQYWI